MQQDRIHAQPPDHHVDEWTPGVIQSLGERDGHCVVTVSSDTGVTVELIITFAIRDLMLSRLDTDSQASPVGERVWYRTRGD